VGSEPLSHTSIITYQEEIYIIIFCLKIFVKYIIFYIFYVIDDVENYKIFTAVGTRTH